eukprot:GHVT01089411.1.p1 GENE.GHVT01089411.1~~GHVT01089411.1.p1  ORF type:complete len:235 (+),score=48.49 GHVT01089411.1:159-863(+)
MEASAVTVGARAAAGDATRLVPPGKIDLADRERGRLMDGKAVAAGIRAEVKVEVDKMLQEHNQKPKLAVILVGERKDSFTYVNMKEKACAECGIDSLVVRLPSTCTQEEVEAAVLSVASDATVDGLLVQLPVPPHIHELSVVRLIPADKDVDGLHEANVGRLALRGRKPIFTPCTAEATVELCKKYHVPLQGAEVVVLGRSDIVGMPACLLFQQEDATVTCCHSKTKDVQAHCR